MQSPAKASVLIVDDRPEKLLATEALLTDMPLIVVKANSGRKASAAPAGAGLCGDSIDVDMPIMDGFETAELIRKRKHCEHVPIIFMTAHSDEQYMQARLFAGGGGLHSSAGGAGDTQGQGLRICRLTFQKLPVVRAGSRAETPRPAIAKAGLILGGDQCGALGGCDASTHHRLRPGCHRQPSGHHVVSHRTRKPIGPCP